MKPGTDTKYCYDCGHTKIQPEGRQPQGARRYRCPHKGCNGKLIKRTKICKCGCGSEFDLGPRQSTARYVNDLHKEANRQAKYCHNPDWVPLAERPILYEQRLRWPFWPDKSVEVQFDRKEWQHQRRTEL